MEKENVTTTAAEENVVAAEEKGMAMTEEKVVAAEEKEPEIKANVVMMTEEDKEILDSYLSIKHDPKFTAKVKALDNAKKKMKEMMGDFESGKMLMNGQQIVAIMSLKSPESLEFNDVKFQNDFPDDFMLYYDKVKSETTMISFQV